MPARSTFSRGWSGLGAIAAASSSTTRGRSVETWNSPSRLPRRSFRLGRFTAPSPPARARSPRSSAPPWEPSLPQIIEATDGSLIEHRAAPDRREQPRRRPELRLKLAEDLTVVTVPLIEHGRQDAQQLQLRVQSLPHPVDGLEEERHAHQRKIVGLDRDQHVSGRRQRVDRQEAKRGHRVDQDYVKHVLKWSQALPQKCRAIPRSDKLALAGSEPDARPDEGRPVADNQIRRAAGPRA